MDILTIFDEYLTLGQLIKQLGLVSTGGQAKLFLEEYNDKVFVNAEAENRRGRKLYSGDFIDFPEHEISVILKKASEEEIFETKRIKAIEKDLSELYRRDRTKAKKPKSPFHQ